jgi:hypothetical protein
VAIDFSDDAPRIMPNRGAIKKDLEAHTEEFFNALAKKYKLETGDWSWDQEATMNNAYNIMTNEVVKWLQNNW